MTTRDRRVLERLLKTWAQDHTPAFTIADYDPTEAALRKTESHLTWVIREEHANIDLVSLANKIETFMEKPSQAQATRWYVLQVMRQLVSVRGEQSG